MKEHAARLSDRTRQDSSISKPLFLVAMLISNIGGELRERKEERRAGSVHFKHGADTIGEALYTIVITDEDHEADEYWRSRACPSAATLRTK